MLRSIWTKEKIKDFCEITSSKRIFASDYVSQGVPFYRSKEIIEIFNNQLLFVELFISRAKYNEIKERYGVPQINDLLLTSVGTLGVPYLVPKDNEFYFKDGNLTWFRNFKSLSSKFLYYYLISPKGKHSLLASAIGSVQPALTIIALKDIEILTPELKTQKKIAGILGAYDDLIENNVKRIRILEEMAQKIYKEWFIDFKFPGYKKIKFKNTELGRMPYDWQYVSLTNNDVFQLTKNRVIPFDGEKIYLATADVVNTDIVGSGEKITYRNKPSRAKISPVLYSVWFARMSNSFKVLAFDDANMTTMKKLILSSGFLGFKCKKDTFGFVYSYILSEGFNKLKDLYASGATQVSLTDAGLKSIKIRLPTKNLTGDYSKKVKDIISQCNLLKEKNKLLKQTRDLLLSKLISGDIDVEKLEIKN